jgi:hypothetical protein
MCLKRVFFVFLIGLSKWLKPQQLEIQNSRALPPQRVFDWTSDDIDNR